MASSNGPSLKSVAAFAQNMSEKSSNSKVPELHNSGREQLHWETEPQNPNDDATLPKVKSKTCFFVLWPSCHDQSHPIGLQIYNAETANANYGSCSIFNAPHKLGHTATVCG